MGIYITQGNYTQKAMQGMVANPEDRESDVAGLMESVGARLLNDYVTTGEYGFIVVSETVDVKDMVAALMVAGASGGVRNLKSVQGLTTMVAKTTMERAKTVRDGFVAAGADS